MRLAGPVALTASCLMLWVPNAFGASAIPPAEMKSLYKSAGLIERKGKLFVEGFDQPVQPQVDVVDLNGDGQPEVFMLIGGPMFGAAGANLNLYIKNKDGQWKSNFGFPAGGYTLLKTKSDGYPDIAIEGPGACSPVWRWNGREYALYKKCAR